MELVVVAATLILFFGSIFGFQAVSKRPEYEELIESGQKINLNLANLLKAFTRSKSDPLRAAHVKLAKIGFGFFALAVFGLFGPSLIFSVLV